MESENVKLTEAESVTVLNRVQSVWWDLRDVGQKLQNFHYTGETRFTVEHGDYRS
jgi:hypothetical protein